MMICSKEHGSTNMTRAARDLAGLDDLGLEVDSETLAGVI
jgi:hypothetical protein